MNNDSLYGVSLSAREQAVIQKEILAGKYGDPGAVFLTTRALAEKRQVSLVTAHSVLTGLCAAGYIKLVGKRYYLSHGDILEDHKEQTNVIGLLLPQLNNEFFASLAEGVISSAEKNGYSVMMLLASYEERQAVKAIRLLNEYGVAGIINCVPQADQHLASDCFSKIPCISLAHSTSSESISSVHMNTFSVSQKVAQNLIDEGYRHFMYIGSRKKPPETDIRYAAFNMELAKHGLSLAPDDVIRISRDSREDEQLLARYLSGITEPVGIFCYHDLIAAAVYRVCRSINKSIPDEVGVIGFDDLSIATSLSPTLTTVQYRISTMADMAVSLLLAKIRSPDTPCDNYFIEPNLVIRESAALSKQNR